MAQVTKPYTFQNQTTADAGQVNQNFDTLYTLVNGNIDNNNIKAGGINTSNLANEAVTPAKTEGIPYAQDLFSNGFILNGLTVTKDGSILNQVDVTAGVVYIKQADGSLRRFAPTATNFRTSTPNNTYYLDFQPDGTWWWNTGHSQQANYINVATVTSDASSNVATVTQNTNATSVTLMGGATGPTILTGIVAPNGLTGATAASRYVGATTSGAPSSGTFNVGDWCIDQSGAIWICKAAGSPGTWANISAPGNMNLEFEVARFFAAGAAPSGASASAGLNISTSVTSAANPQGNANFTETIYTNAQSSVYFTAAIINKVNASASYQYEANLKTNNSSYTASSALWDITAGAIVAGSTVSTTSTTPTVLRSSNITLVAGHQYVPTLWISSGSTTAILSGARIVGQI